MLKAKNEKRMQNKTEDRFKLCPSCGNFAEFESNEIYCIVCGAKLLEFCPECREPIYYPTAKFCPACGERYGKE